MSSLEVCGVLQRRAKREKVLVAIKQPEIYRSHRFNEMRKKSETRKLFRKGMHSQEYSFLLYMYYSDFIYQYLSPSNRILDLS